MNKCILTRSLFETQYMPPALWATGGLEVVTGKLPLTLPSPRALDPGRLDRLRVYIGFSQAYETQREPPKVQ